MIIEDDAPPLHPAATMAPLWSSSVFVLVSLSIPAYHGVVQGWQRLLTLMIHKKSNTYNFI